MNKNEQLMTLNKVMHKGEIKTIDSICRSMVTFVEDCPSPDKYGDWIDLDEVYFIELTDDMLIELGFIRSVLYHVLLEEQIYLYDSYLDECDFEYRFNYTMVGVRYLHQLENLYYLLTQKHLAPN